MDGLIGGPFASRSQAFARASAVSEAGQETVGFSVLASASDPSAGLSARDAAIGRRGGFSDRPWDGSSPDASSRQHGAKVRQCLRREAGVNEGRGPHSFWAPSCSLSHGILAGEVSCSGDLLRPR
eukprot:scaffold1090_cov265-Pinguiococcus_pyrenoidosus.AAC.21